MQAGDAEALAHTLAELVADPTRREELGRAGALRAEARFAAEVMARSYAALYGQLTRRRGRW